MYEVAGSTQKSLCAVFFNWACTLVTFKVSCVKESTGCENGIVFAHCLIPHGQGTSHNPEGNVVATLYAKMAPNSLQRAATIAQHIESYIFQFICVVPMGNLGTVLDEWQQAASICQSISFSFLFLPQFSSGEVWLICLF